MGDTNLEIRTLSSADDMMAMIRVFQQVWGTVTAVAEVELLCAISHAGGYVSGAYDSEKLVGASFGFLAEHHGERALHSHITGILPGVQHSGVGRIMKNHQREWAVERGIPWITWTFDPLIRRNAWFNIEVLRVNIVEYLVNFYGPMSDSINANDESDRLVAAWNTMDDAPVELKPGGEPIQVATPDNIVMLRRTDPSSAQHWRQQVRRDLGDRITAGATVTGFTRAGSYIVQMPS
jgi:predicted GNAT superfamily acetyltransferase